FFFSSRRRHTRFSRDWSSDVCSSDLERDVLEIRSACEDDLRAVAALAAEARDDSPEGAQLGAQDTRRLLEHLSVLLSAGGPVLVAGPAGRGGGGVRGGGGGGPPLAARPPPSPALLVVPPPPPRPRRG